MNSIDQMKSLPVVINGKRFVPDHTLTAKEAASVALQFIRCTFDMCGKRCTGDDDCLRRLDLARHFVGSAA